MAEAIRRALEDPGLGERGREHVAKLSWEDAAARTAAVYRELL